MSGLDFFKTYPEPPLSEREIFRYAGCKEPDEATRELMLSAWKELRPHLRYQACLRALPLSIEGEHCDFGAFSLSSKDLAKSLKNCRSAILFAATIGVGIDRLIARYSRLSPARALMLQAIGAERIEALCDALCRDLAAEKHLTFTPRFSPGYGDLSLEIQKNIISILDCERRMGLCLNKSLLMSHSKAVTAFMGIQGDSFDAI